jgi:polyphosphate glucokinase
MAVRRLKHEILGIDVGGTGIKGAPVDTKNGKLLEERFRVSTPSPATPEAIAREVNTIAKHFKWKGTVGIGFPAVVQQGKARTAANIDKSFIGLDVNELFSKYTGLPVFVLNDADAAGIAEMKFGAGKKHQGVVLLVTVGTGVGTVLFSRRKLVPNLELGHIIMHGVSAEKNVSDLARREQDLSWAEWVKRFDEYMHYLEDLLWPDIVIIGGGLSKKPEKFENLLTIKAKVMPAKLLNDAGMIGSAVAARDMKKILDL